MAHDLLPDSGGYRVICVLSTTQILFHVIDHTCYSYQWSIMWNKIRVVDDAQITLVRMGGIYSAAEC